MLQRNRIAFAVLIATALSLNAATFASAQTDFGPRPYGPHDTQERWGAYQTEGADNEVRYLLVKPRGDRPFPGIYYVYGRPGLDERLMQELRRLASYGFTIFVSHFQEALFLPNFPMDMDPPQTLQVVGDGFDKFLKMSERTAGKVCVLGTVRGGYYAVKLASRSEVACLVGLHPVITDHALPEQYQEVTVLKDIRSVRVPTLLMVGSQDFEVRVNQSKRAAQYLAQKGIPVDLVIYQGAARGFDFRTVERTLADDLAKMDSMYRTVEFINRHLGYPNSAGPSAGPQAAAPIPNTVQLPYIVTPRGTGGTLQNQVGR